MIRKILKGIAGLFVLMVVFNMFFERASETLEKNKSESLMKDGVNEEKNIVDSDGILPKVPSTPDYDDVIEFNDIWPLHYYGYISLGELVEYEGNPHYLLSMSPSRFDGGILGLIEKSAIEKLEIGDKVQLDGMYLVAEKGKRIESLGYEDKKIHKIVQIYTKETLGNKEWETSKLKSISGNSNFDECEDSQQLYLENDKFAWPTNCAFLLGNNEKWSCVNSGVQSFEGFSKAVESCGVKDVSEEVDKLCEEITNRAEEIGAIDWAGNLCMDLIGYQENWECVEKSLSKVEFDELVDSCGIVER